VEAGIAFRVREAFDSVAHHETHRAGVEVRPDAFGPEFALDRQEIIGDAVERLIPTDWRELAASLRAYTAQRLGKPIRVMNSLPIAGDLGADYTGRICLITRAVDTADTLSADHLDVQSAYGRAVVWTD
jgi:hypothetical protein